MDLNPALVKDRAQSESEGKRLFSMEYPDVNGKDQGLKLLFASLCGSEASSTSFERGPSAFRGIRVEESSPREALRARVLL